MVTLLADPSKFLKWVAAQGEGRVMLSEGDCTDKGLPGDRSVGRPSELGAEFKTFVWIAVVVGRGKGGLQSHTHSALAGG